FELFSKNLASRTGKKPSQTLLVLCFLQGSASGLKDKRWPPVSGRSYHRKIIKEKNVENILLKMTSNHHDVKIHSISLRDIETSQTNGAQNAHAQRKLLIGTTLQTQL